MEQHLINPVAAETLEAACKIYPATALAFLTEEVQARAAALELTCIGVALYASGANLEVIAFFDLNDDEGAAYEATFNTELETSH